MKMKTLGQKLMEASKTETVKLTDKYWGSEFFKASDQNTYWVRHHKQGFGGMKSRDVRVLAKDVAGCNSTEDLAALLKPTNDEADGDPMNYAPRNVQPVELTWTPAEKVAA
jgi:hypothetical protein